MTPLYILKVGSTHPDIAAEHGDFEDWVETGLGLPDAGVQVIDTAAIGNLPHWGSLRGLVITGAHEMVTDGAPWMDLVCDWLRQLVEQRVPILAICYGHQLLAHALGGQVGFNPRGREVGTVTVRCTESARHDPLFSILPESFPAQSSHAQSVMTLQTEAVSLASSDQEPIHAFRIGRIAWGVQFHPEFSETVMRCYVHKQRDALTRQGSDPAMVARAVTPSPAGDMLLRFAILTSA